MIEVEPTRENLERLGYARDDCLRGWYSEESAQSGKRDCGDGRGFVPHYQRFYFPPFGFTDKMLCDGIKLFRDDNWKLVGWKKKT